MLGDLLLNCQWVHGAIAIEFIYFSFTAKLSIFEVDTVLHIVVYTCTAGAHIPPCWKHLCVEWLHVCICEPLSKSFFSSSPPLSDNFDCAALNPDHRSLFFFLHCSLFAIDICFV